MRLNLTFLLVTVSLAGCVTYPVGTDPQPAIDIPAQFSLGVDDAPALHAPWWETFGDPALNAIVETALRDNLELAQGESRIERARALVRQSRAVQFPQADAFLEGDRQWTREVHRDTGITDPSSRNDTTRTYAAGVTMSWEADLWGRLHNATQSQREQLAAIVYDYDALRLFLSAQIVETYYQIIEQNLLLTLLGEQRDLAQTFLELIELRFLQGDANAVDILQQRSQLAEIEAEIPVARSQLGLLENRLDVLMGVAPDGEPRIDRDTATLPESGELPAVGIPVGLLARRPDLVAAQRRVVAQDYEIAVAIAERLPRLTLDGSFAYTDPSGANTLMAIGSAALFQPILDWGLRKAQVDAARATFEEFLLAFSQNYLLAIEEVETTLWQEARQRELIEATRNLEEILSRTVEESRARYSLGVSDYLPVLTALQDLQSVQRDLIQQRRNLVSFRIQLFRAIGAPTAPGPSPEKVAETNVGSEPPNSL